MLCEDGSGVSLNLTEGNGFKSSGALKAEGESTDTAEEIKDFEFFMVVFQNDGSQSSPSSSLSR